MKNIFFVLILFSAIHASAQVKFEKLSLDDAISKAASSGKVLFAQFISATCEQCNEVADVAFADKDLEQPVKKKFVAIRIELNDPAREQFIQRYNPSQSMGTYFISGDGELVHRYPATNSSADEYIKQMDKALSNLIEGKATLAELNKEWNNNPSNIPAMEANLIKRSSLGLPNDSLLDVYVQRLPNDSFNSQRTLAFILKQAPSLFSKADLKIKKDQNFYTTTWYTLPLSDRVNINNRIAAKSLKIAIAEKSRAKANTVARFHAGTHTDRYSKAAQKTYDKKMLDYFIGIKDTSTYLKKAVDYYETYYMSEPLSKVQEHDSLARIKAMENSKVENIRIVDPASDRFAKTLDSIAPDRRTRPLNLDNPKDLALKKMLDSAVAAMRKNNPQNMTSTTTRRVVAQQSFTYAPTTQYYANDLNAGAWLLYTSTSDKKYLDKALAFSKRATEAFTSPELMDTYARVLYKTDDQQQAIEVLQKAIDIVKQRQRNSVPRFEAVLNKMKAGEVID